MSKITFLIEPTEIKTPKDRFLQIIGIWNSLDGSENKEDVKRYGMSLIRETREIYKLYGDELKGLAYSAKVYSDFPTFTL